MSETPQGDAAGWRVVGNDAGAHSVWPTTRPLPAGWHPVPGTVPLPRDEALAAVAGIWVDHRPAGVGSRS